LVDALNFAAGTKRLIRTRLIDGFDVRPILDWCKANELFGKVDEDRFVVAGKHAGFVEHALRVDRSFAPHEITPGLLFGYPVCCCKAAADAGVAEIDRLAELESRREFSGDYSLIDPSGYTEGESLVCDVPCSPRCSPSLQLAYRALAFLQEHPRLLVFGNWQAVLQRIKHHYSGSPPGDRIHR
jgi:hypothetical protein